MIDINKLSKKYTIRKLNENDIDIILDICLNNELFYQYADASPTKKQIINDLNTTPIGIDISDKYYLGFFENELLVSIIDLIDGYPNKDTVFIGFFMMNKDYQGNNIGTAIIQEALESLKTMNFKYARLAIDKDNPQSNHFWHKNGFEILKEVDRNGHKVLLAESII